MLFRHRKGVLTRSVGSVEGAYPIPEPNKRLGAIYRTNRSDVWTLQEQMHLEDDPETFSELMARGNSPLLCTSCLDPDAGSYEASDGQSRRHQDCVQVARPATSREYQRGGRCPSLPDPGQGPGYPLLDGQVLAQWPTLEEMYVDTWPITYYLKRALKHWGIP